ncbi:hypothetical protein H6784_00620 [Candidatus Nomurabacteria bacterium]|nr:hypothetical protein [Candidatus Nomurabacteria bacterium]
MNTKIGFIGQGWIGKHYADDFENRSYETVRYSLEEPYIKNKDLIKDCNITLIAVPTPTTPEGFDASIIEAALTLIGVGNVAVIKSTTMPGVTVALQNKFPEIIILHSPEFLVEKTAAHDAAFPERNIIGVPIDNEQYQKAAQKVLAILPRAPYQKVMTSQESELVKYAGNCFLYTKVLYMNILHDIVTKSGADFEIVRDALVHDPRIGESHTQPIHTSGHTEATKEIKRGAGGHCLIKDFEAFREYYRDTVSKDDGYKMLTDMANYNNYLLRKSNKDLDLLKGVYGDGVVSSDFKLE